MMTPTVLAAFFSLLRLRSCEMMCSLAKRDAISDVRFSAVDVIDDVDVLEEDGGLADSCRASRLPPGGVLTSSQLLL